MITREESHTIATKAPADAFPTAVRVLLVEDDRSLRRYLEVVMDRAGYTVVSASDGLEAIKALMTSSIDLVITDALMPNLSGHELCRFIRSSPQFAETPIILLSALERTEATCDTQTVDAFLSKPVSATELLSCLEQLSRVMVGHPEVS